MNRLVKSDLFRYEGKYGIISFIKTFFLRPGFRFSFFLRKAAQSSKFLPIKLFYQLFHRHYMFKYGFQIPVSTSIDEGLYIGHFGTVVVNKNAQIGKNCNISHGVTIGRAYRGKSSGSPVIGNSVWIGTGAVIVGNIKIGDNVLIAPNSYVNFDVPGNSIVIGNPAKIIFNVNATDGYLNNKVGS